MVAIASHKKIHAMRIVLNNDFIAQLTFIYSVYHRYMSETKGPTDFFGKSAKTGYFPNRLLFRMLSLPPLFN
jgi:hypothetical protein